MGKKSNERAGRNLIFNGRTLNFDLYPDWHFSGQFHPSVDFPDIERGVFFYDCESDSSSLHF